MKKLLTVLISLALLSTFALAGWQHAETVFDFSADDTTVIGTTDPITGDFVYQNSPHGIVVDAEGKIWVQFYMGNTEGFLFNDYTDMDGDGVTTDDTSYYKPVWVFNSDGSMASFSPIKTFDLPGGGTDTFHVYSEYNGAQCGMSLDNDGNVILSSWASIYRFNYQTGECMGRYTATDKSTLTEPVQASDGTIYHSYVLAGARPCIMLDTDLGYVGNAIDTLGYITRSMLVEDADGGGQNLYFGTTWNGWGVPKYYSSNPLFYSFDIVDTLGNYTDFTWQDSTYESIVMWSSSIDWAPDGNILVGCLRQTWAGDLGSRWHILNKETNEIDEYFGTPAPDSAAANPDIYIAGGVNGPRGGYFTDDQTLYTVDFYMWTLDKWTYTTDVKEEPKVANEFRLKQNYPNPFNPTTTIPFVLDKKSAVTLKVYNMLGNEVSTLVDNEVRIAGPHQVEFNALGNPTGMYIYRLSVDGQEQTKKMLFIK